MSNKREIEPSLDYFELRRRHEEYKNSQRQKDGPEAAEEAAEAPERAVGAADAPVEQTRYEAEPAVAEPAPEIAPEGETPRFEAGDAAPAAGNASGELDLDDSMDGEDGGAEDVNRDDAPSDGVQTDGGELEGAADVDNPNPFDSFIHAFKGIRGKLSDRFGRRNREEPYEDDALADDALADDALVDETAGEAPEGEPVGAAGTAAATPSAPVVPSESDGAPQADAAVEDVLDEAPAAQSARDVASDAAPEDETFDEADEEYEEDDVPERKGRFKRFLRLFVVPVDEDEAGGEALEYEVYGEESGDGPDAGGAPEHPAEPGDWERGDAAAWAAPVPATDENEGGPDMSDLNNVNTELTDALAAGLEGSGMSRRERRELAQRLAAEKAAAKAAAQAEVAQAAAEKAEAAAQEAGEVVQAAPEKAEEAVLEADAVADVSSGIVNVEPAKDDYDVIMDEPTREFKPVSKANLDDLMNDKDLKDGSDENKEEEEEREKPARRGLFGRRRRAEDEEDDEDEDDEDDEDEDERPRRGLFGRRRRDEEDDEDDEDDDDEDDEDDRRSRRGRRRYDEDDDDYDDDDYDDDDYDDYDDEDEGTSFGHVLLGILKGFLTAVMLLLFVVVVLNVLNIFNVISLEGLARRLPTRMVSIFLPSEGMKQRINVEANTNPAPVAEGEPLVPQTAQTPAEAPAAEAPAAEAPAVEAPAEEAPAEEAPAEEAPAEEAPAEAAPAAENGSEAVG